MQQQRLLSLDVMRGIIMILLAGESCLLYESLHDLPLKGFADNLVEEFFHHPWHGLHFWDLVQPAFMTMAGSAMYWLNDVKKLNRYAWIFVVVGMNSIFIYLFFETLGYQWLDKTIGIFVKGFSGFAGMPDKVQSVFSAIVTLFSEWYLCYWLYKRKIFFKL